jgi:hypothetical protein
MRAALLINGKIFYSKIPKPQLPPSSYLSLHSSVVSFQAKRKNKKRGGAQPGRDAPSGLNVGLPASSSANDRLPQPGQHATSGMND